MRVDGDVTYYAIEHHCGSWAKDSWVPSALDHFLFANLTSDQKNGPIGNRYRSLLHPQSATSDLWQRYGINGFVDKDDGLRMLQELRALPWRDDYYFRLVKRTLTQETLVVA
jgi:hypothetical protein